MNSARILLAGLAIALVLPLFVRAQAHEVKYLEPDVSEEKDLQTIRVIVIDPALGEAVHTQEYTVEGLDLDGVTSTPSGGKERRQALDIPDLFPGSYPVRAIAVDEGGLASVSSNELPLEIPSQLFIDRLVAVNADGTVFLDPYAGEDLMIGQNRLCAYVGGGALGSIFLRVGDFNPHPNAEDLERCGADGEGYLLPGDDAAVPGQFNLELVPFDGPRGSGSGPGGPVFAAQISLVREDLPPPPPELLQVTRVTIDLQENPPTVAVSLSDGSEVRVAGSMVRVVPVQ